MAVGTREVSTYFCLTILSLSLYSQSSSLLSWLFGQLLLIMIIYFILSIVNSMAQSFAKRRDEETVHQLLHPECHNTHHST